MSHLMRIPRIVLATLAICFAPMVTADGLDISLVYVGPLQGSAHAGVRQGLDEANIQGRFLGQNYHLDEATLEQALAGELSGYSAILTSLDSDELRQLAAAYPDIPVLNLSNGDDALRRACIPNLLHVIPSQRMLADAEAQWRRKHPDATARAQAWHYSMRKFAAAQLNSRFKKAQGQAMDDQAWAGWAAVRLLSDVVAHNQTAKARELLRHMHKDLAFDGQKGIDMSFRETGQLRQPLLLIEDDRIAGMAPVRGVAKSTRLDTLGVKDCTP